MFGWFRKQAGWQVVRGGGFSIEMPARPEIKRQTMEASEGAFSLLIYLARAEGLTCQVTIREGQAVEKKSNAELIRGWKEEFFKTMMVSGIQIQLESEAPLPDFQAGWEMTFQSDRGVTIRVRLLLEGVRLIALVATAPRGLMVAEARRFLTSFVRQ